MALRDGYRVIRLLIARLLERHHYRNWDCGRAGKPPLLYILSQPFLVVIVDDLAHTFVDAVFAVFP